MLPKQLKINNRYFTIGLKITMYGWVILWLLCFIYAIASMFPGNKIGEEGYQLYVGLAIAAFSFAMLIFPFCMLYNMAVYGDRKNKKIGSRKKVWMKKARIRICLHFIVYGFASFLSLLGLAFVINIFDNLIFLFYVIVDLFILYFGIKYYRKYCKDHPVKKIDRGSIWFLIGINCLWLVPFIISGVYTTDVVSDQPYLDNPKVVELEKVKIVVHYRLRSKFHYNFYYNVSGVDEEGEAYHFRIDGEKATKYYKRKPDTLKVYYLPNTMVVMEYK